MSKDQNAFLSRIDDDYGETESEENKMTANDKRKIEELSEKLLKVFPPTTKGEVTAEESPTQTIDTGNFIQKKKKLTAKERKKLETTVDTAIKKPIILTDTEKKVVFEKHKKEIPKTIDPNEKIEEIILPKHATLCHLPEKLLIKVTKDVLENNNKEDQETKKEIKQERTSQDCELIIAQDKTIPANRLISFITRNKPSETKKDLVICFDVVELYKASLDDWEKNQGGKKIENVLVPNIARNYFDKDYLKEINYDFDYFSENDSNYIHQYFKEYSEFLRTQSQESTEQLNYMIDFFIAPFFKNIFNYVPELVEKVFGKGFVEKAASIFYPVTWIVEQGWFKSIKSGIYKATSAVFNKIYSTVKYYTRFITNNAIFINLALYTFSILRTLFCVYFMGPQVGLRSIKEWIANQRSFVETTRYGKLMLTVLSTLLDCAFSVGTASFNSLWYCGVQGIVLAFKLILGPIASLANIVGYFFGDPALFKTPESSKSLEQIKDYGLSLMNLDWSVMGNVLWIFIPKFIRVFLCWFPISPHLYTAIDVGLKLSSNYMQIFTVYSSLIHFVLHTIKGIWDCINFSGDCCFPRALKQNFTEANKRIDERLESKNKGWIHRGIQSVLGKNWYGDYTREQIINLDNLEGGVSDDRAKIKIGDSGLTVDGLKVNLYILNPTFMRKVKSVKKKKNPLPTWLEDLYEKTYFKENGHIFYSVSAQETQKIYPEAVGEFKTRKLSFLYLKLDKLPDQLHSTIHSLNQQLLSAPLQRKKTVSFKKEKKNKV